MPASVGAQPTCCRGAAASRSSSSATCRPSAAGAQPRHAACSLRIATDARLGRAQQPAALRAIAVDGASFAGAGASEPHGLEAGLAVTLEAITAPVAADMATMNKNVRSLVGDRHPMLLAAAEQIFGAGGKKIRPMLCFLVARATVQAAGLPCAPARPVVDIADARR